LIELGRVSGEGQGGATKREGQKKVYAWEMGRLEGERRGNKEGRQRTNIDVD
jgi:hypothetical protein